MACLLLLAGAPAAVRAVPPTASFTVSNSAPRVGAPVTFTPNITPMGTATITSVAWAFGDTGTGTGNAAVQHAYGATGPVTATMTVTDSNGEKTTAQQALTVAANPSADFTFSPGVPNVSGQPNSTVTFNAAASTDPKGLPLATYQWGFGDGSPAVNGAQPAHTYGQPGDKPVTLKVTAQDGTTASITKTLHVNVSPNGKLIFTVPATDLLPGQDPFTPLIGQRVLFDALGSSDPDGTIGSYAWDLAGSNAYGAPGAQSSAITSFGSAGRRTVHVRVADNGGAQDVATASFRVNRRPTASMTVSPASPGVGDTVTLTSTSTDPDPAPDKIVSTQWELSGNSPPKFGDAGGPTARTSFATPGRRQVLVKVTDTGGAYDVATLTINVQAAPAPRPAAVAFSGATPTAPAAPVAPTSGPTTVAARSLPGVRVRIAGSVTGLITRVSLLTIAAPKDTIVKVSCRGRGCPKSAARARVPTKQQVRVRAMERALRAGATLIVTITKPGYLTREVRFTIRRGKPPVRHDACVIGPAHKTGPCPS